LCGDLQLADRDLAEYERLREIAENREVKAMEMTWAEKMELQYTQKGKVEALHHVLLRLLGRRFGAIPDAVRRKVEAIDSTESLGKLAEKVLEVDSIDDMGL
jgi:Domain of unknown function (DUF4351)